MWIDVPLHVPVSLTPFFRLFPVHLIPSFLLSFPLHPDMSKNGVESEIPIRTVEWTYCRFHKERDLVCSLSQGRAR